MKTISFFLCAILLTSTCIAGDRDEERQDSSSRASTALMKSSAPGKDSPEDWEKLLILNRRDEGPSICPFVVVCSGVPPITISPEAGRFLMWTLCERTIFYQKKLLAAKFSEIFKRIRDLRAGLESLLELRRAERARCLASWDSLIS